MGALGKAFVGQGSGTKASDGADTKADTATTAEASSEETKKDDADAPVALGQEFTIDDWSVTILSVGEPVAQVGNDFLNAQAKGVFVPVSITASNTGKDASYFSAGQFKLLDDQDREFEYSSEATIYGSGEGSAPIFDKVNPGTTVEGTIYFDVPADANLASLKVEGGFLTKPVIVSLK